MFMKWLTVDSWIHSFTWRRKIGFSALVFLVLLSVSACSLLPKEDQEETLPAINPPKLSKKPEYTVTTQTIEMKVTAIGRLMSTHEETLFFTGGSDSDSGSVQTGEMRVKEVYVHSGENVQKGQLLAELDVTDLERRMRSEKLRFRKDYEIPMIETLRNADQMDPAELEQKKLDFELQRTELQDMQDIINGAKLTAPFAGTVVAVMVQKGDTVQAYDAAAIVADLSELTVAADIGADDLQKIAVGMEAVVDINNAGEFNGIVKQLPVISKNNNSGNGNYYNPNQGNNNPQTDTIDNYLIVELQPFPEGVNRGTPLSVNIITNRKEHATVIPTAALRSNVGRKYVQVAEQDGLKREVDVEIGQQTSTVIEIVKGLQPGQKVVGR